MRPYMLIILLVPLFLGAGNKTGIRETSHNLSVSGKGSISAISETRVCIFCHSSHNGSTEGPLWNHVTPSVTQFKTYDRSTLASQAEQPNGATKLCLSCHDGTVAVGAIKGVGSPIELRNTGGNGEIPAGRKSNLGRDLSGTHPVSIRYGQDTAISRKSLRWPPIDPEDEVGTDAQGYVQCTSCHDPHGSRSEKYPFWKKESYSAVCVVCHAY